MQLLKRHLCIPFPVQRKLLIWNFGEIVCQVVAKVMSKCFQLSLMHESLRLMIAFDALVRAIVKRNDALATLHSFSSFDANDYLGRYIFCTDCR